MTAVDWRDFRESRTRGNPVTPSGLEFFFIALS
jgi:hypothetical protein